MNCLIFTPEMTPRVTYTMQSIFGPLPELEYQVVCNKEEYLSFAGVKINYSAQRLTTAEIFIPAGQLLFEDSIHPIEIAVGESNGRICFFMENMEDADFDFDLPAMVFYLLSRYEEYLPFMADKHGRFPARESLAFKNGFLDMPLINMWIDHLRSLLNKKFPKLNLQKLAYHFQPTYDIDQAWAFLNYGWRTWAGWWKDAFFFNKNRLILRTKVVGGKLPDPFYTFDYLTALHQKYGLSPQWFFLLGDYGKYDKNVYWKNSAFQNLIKNIDSKDSIGIHPSYASNENFQKLEEEILRLALIKKSTVIASRQHYLKLSFPDTYRALLKAGVESDYSLGFADHIGFRAGIAGPFNWYDLEKEQTTPLIIHPFQVMDVTLKNYLKFSQQEALEAVTKLVKETKKYGGSFSILWHNSSFSGLHRWEGWDTAYEEIIKACL